MTGTGEINVLVAEDETRLAQLLVDAFTLAGWQCTSCSTGSAVLALVRTGDIDVIVLDWMLPGLDGPGVIRALREEGHSTPVLMLTARSTIPDRVHGLSVGADDYLTKPFDVDELIARVHALHRRANPGLATAHRIGDLFIDPVSRRVERGGRAIDVSARELDILLYLAQRAGQVVTRYAIFDAVWDGDTDIRSNVIDVYVASLRNKVDKPFGRATIQTVRGSGYRIDPDGR